MELSKRAHNSCDFFFSCSLCLSTLPHGPTLTISLRSTMLSPIQRPMTAALREALRVHKFKASMGSLVRVCLKIEGKRSDTLSISFVFMSSFPRSKVNDLLLSPSSTHLTPNCNWIILNNNKPAKATSMGWGISQLYKGWPCNNPRFWLQ